MFTTIIVKPIYNLLILLVDFLTSDLGLAMVVLTIIIRIILFPLFKSQIRTQIKMQQVQGPLKEIQNKYKDNREKLGQEMLKIYRDNKINPFSGFLLLLIQIPVLIGLYHVFTKLGLPSLNEVMLYDFVPRPDDINHIFLGIFDITKKSLPLAILVFVTQFIQMKIMIPKDIPGVSNNSGQTSVENMMKNMQKQMLYFMPIMTASISYAFGTIIAIYFLVSNIFSIFQEIYIRKTIREPEMKKIQDAKA